MTATDLIEQEQQIQKKVKDLLRGKMLEVRDTAVKAEGEIFLEALKATKLNKSKAADLLGMNRKTFYTKFNAYKSLVNNKDLASGV